MKIHETSGIFMKMTDVKMTQMRLVKVKLFMENVSF